MTKVQKLTIKSTSEIYFHDDKVAVDGESNREKCSSHAFAPAARPSSVSVVLPSRPLGSSGLVL